MKKVYVFLLLASLGVSCGIKAQEASYTLTAGASQPVGKFADSSYEGNALVSPNQTRGDKGGAVTGFNFGIKRSVSLSDRLDWFLSAQLFYSRLNSSFDDQIGDHYTSGIFTHIEARVDKPAYYNIPFMAGITYSMPLSSPLFNSLFCEVAAGANLREISAYEVSYVEYYGAEGSYRSHYDASVRPAAELGLGVKFGKRYSIGAYLNYLGSAKTKEIQKESLGNFSANYDYSSNTLTTTQVSLKLGYSF